MKNVSKTVRGPLVTGIKLEENIYVGMRDGIKIAVDVYRPEAGGRYPVLFSMAPYIKEIQQWPAELSHSIEAGATNFFVPNGYVHVIAQLRGTGMSQGQYNFFSLKEHQDGYDMIEWIAKQNWCNGNVGMIGDSYFAMIQYLVASEQPPHLKCIAPYDGCTDIYRDFTYQGGIFFGWFLGMWGPDMIRQCIWPGPVDGKLPPANIFADIASHRHDDEYYHERSAIYKLNKIKVPVMFIVPQLGFLHSRGQLLSFSKVNTPKKLLVVPPAGLHAHELFLTNEHINKQLLRWYDYWLKGKNTGIMDEPPVAICDSVTRDWRYENEYPLERTKWTKFYLHSDLTRAASNPPYGLLSLEPAANEPPDSYFIQESMKRAGKREPVLAYATGPLKEDTKVWGPLSMSLFGSSTTLDTEWFVNISDIGTDGKVNPVTMGRLQASLRDVDESKSNPGQPFHTFNSPALPEPEKIYEYQIELMPIFRTFKAGHKIWVQIASADFWYQEHLRTIEVSELLPLPAKNTVYHDSDHLSHLLLPVIPDIPEIKPVESPVSEIKAPNL